MKISASDYTILKTAIAEKLRAQGKELPAITEEYAREGLSEKRLCFDLLAFSGLKIGDGVGVKGNLNLYAYMNDDHIHSALKQIFRELSGK